LGRVNFLVLKLLLSLSIAGSISTLCASTSYPPCITDSLQGYISTTLNPPTTGGCSIGGLSYFDFSYHLVTGSLQASAIEVTPGASGFSFGPVSTPAGQTLQFEIDYDTVTDPAPIITGDKLGLDVTGNVVVTEYFCNDLTYVYSGSCEFGFQPAVLTVGSPATGLPSSASITFNPPATTQQVGILFTLTGGASGASFEGLDSESVLSSVPEPPAAASLFLGFLAIAAAVFRKRARHQALPVIN
jgi:hypothetical protein